jgi:hypothetical protein
MRAHAHAAATPSAAVFAYQDPGMQKDTFIQVDGRTYWIPTNSGLPTEAKNTLVAGEHRGATAPLAGPSITVTGMAARSVRPLLAAASSQAPRFSLADGTKLLPVYPAFDEICADLPHFSVGVL